MSNIVERLRLRGTDICCEAAEQIERDEEHYQAAMAMSEKHRTLWVEESQKNKSLEAEIERLLQVCKDKFSLLKHAFAEIERLKATRAGTGEER